jgi:hypothetical protein
MAIDKSELKKSVFNDLGADIEDLCDGAKISQAEYRGAKKALRVQAKKLESVLEFVNKELDEGKFKAEEFTELYVADKCKLYVQRCIDALESAWRHHENLEISASGGVVALGGVVTTIKKKMDAEQKKIEDLIEHESKEPEPQPVVEPEPKHKAKPKKKSKPEKKRPEKARPVGARPGPSVAAKRKAEANARNAR